MEEQKKVQTQSSRPSLQQLEAELKREKYKAKYRQTLRSTVYILIVTAAIVVILTFLLVPVFRIYGTSMSPTVNEGEIIVGLKGSSFQQGDIIVLTYNNKLLVKRVIAGPAEWVDIDISGNVTVNGVMLDEPYLKEKAYGNCNISLPYQVPDGKYFVMGDNRATSQDSRDSAIGCIPIEQIVGRAELRIWPLDRFSRINNG